MKKDAYYMKHDVNASRDERVLEMRSEWGTEGYGMYWLVNEFLREQSECSVSLKKIKLIAFSQAMDPERLEEFIHACIDEYGLYESDGEVFWSNRLMKDKQQFDAAREKNRAKAQKRWGKEKDEPQQSTDNAPAMPQHTNGNTDGKQRHTNGKAPAMQEKKRKEKKRKEEKRKTPFGEFGNVHLLEEEYEKLVAKHGRGATELMIEKLANFKLAHGKKYQSDYGAINNWVAKAVKEEIAKNPQILKARQQKYHKKKPILTKCSKCGGEVISDGETARCRSCNALFELRGDVWEFVEYVNIRVPPVLSHVIGGCV